MFILEASKSSLTVRQRELMTSGSVNVNTVKFELSADWDGLTRTAVFRNDAENRSVLLDDTNQCEIPREALSSAGQRVYAGVYGTRGGEIVLPTIWTSLGVVLEGAAPAGGTYPPTPELWEQELAKKQDKLHGETGQLVGFDESGNAVAQDAGEAMQGPPGPQGVPGEDGKSAYQIAVENGFEGTEEEWLESLQGPPGKDGAQGPAGPPGADGKDGEPGTQGPPGQPGKDGADGADGAPGPAGADGKSAYQIAVDNGYTGTETEWIASLKGAPGTPGAPGRDGSPGPAGADGSPGADGATFMPAVSADGTLSWTNDGNLPNPTPVNIKGPAGADGEDGAPGAPGTNGEDGENGVTFTPSVSSDGVLSWTNDGGLPNPEPINIKGPAGQNGTDGTDGQDGVGVPAGGAAGQILSKKTAADYDTQWIDAPQGGGTTLTAGDGLTITDGVASVDTPVRNVLTQAEYDALPEDKQSKGMYVIKDVGGGGSGGSSESLDVYSTEEKKIGTWIDGKPLYRKVFLGTIPSDTNVHYICSFPSEYEPKMYQSYLERSDGFSTGTFCSGATGYNTQTWIDNATNHALGIQVGNQYIQYIGGKTCTLILEYTKTTDQPEVTS